MNTITRRIKLLLSLGMVGLCALTSCNKNSPTGPNPIGPQIIPLAVGNTWQYDGFEYDTVGVVTMHFGGIEFVRQDSTVFGHSYYLYEGQGGLCANTDSGMIRILPNLSGVYSFLVYKYPTRLGELYQSDSLTVVVSSVDSLLQTTAGSFHCIKYAFTYHGFKYFDDYVCPGIGRIEYVAYYVNPASARGQIGIQAQLQQYQLN